MGCGASSSHSSDEYDNNTQQEQASAPADDRETESMSLTAIMNMNKVEDEGIPEGYPAKPAQPAMSGDSEEEYKRFMRAKYKLEQWENGLILYRMKIKEGNMQACEQIVARIETELQTE
mmetsp:Transcript_2774/g.3106  ORF Transcript_2774/g.3106 Transcript_2774/m.3106 type:complete len:119 (+) Transcript_2774:77-433(+)|eukprot:CAMPEP_0168537382 /NCGR_PEP_ID=MMETSP0405-20121227/20292_1 /TAXON_ID=498012 /ORGANISM="Trichosphaerium sp, Strain Am-I-7 wt" /LENGTH=118 /DNA_ID=CAMNT_0008565929 /DNA_START=65 /DNA_END=421 /DNA_ORIENTATION=-